MALKKTDTVDFLPLQRKSLFDLQRGEGRAPKADLNPRVYLCLFGDVQLKLAHTKQDDCFGLFRRSLTNFGIGYSFNMASLSPNLSTFTLLAPYRVTQANCGSIQSS